MMSPSLSQALSAPASADDGKPAGAPHGPVRATCVCSLFADGDQQAAFDVSVVIPTIGRPALARALESVFDQDFVGRIQVLVGYDKGWATPPERLLEALRRRPVHVSVLMLHLPYSTSARSGGQHAPWDGGALRSILSYMANSRFVAYLDDDNRYRPAHLRNVLKAVQGHAVAFAPRLLVDEVDGAILGEDIWHSVGPDKGLLAAAGGLIDPNCLVVDKVAVGFALGRWAELQPGAHFGDTADRWFFAGIRDLPIGFSAEPTVEYQVRRDNVLWRLATTNAAASAHPGN